MHLGLLRRRPIAVLWAATTLSIIGDRLYALAVWWLVWEATRSAVLLGVVAVVESVPYIAAGLWGRRVHTRVASWRGLAALDGARLLVVAVLPLAWSGGGAVDIALLLAVALLLGIGGAAFDAPVAALVPGLVRGEEVPAAVALMDLPGRVARIAGPGLAALLLAVVSPVSLYLIDAATFAVSALALLGLSRHRPSPAVQASAEPATPEASGVRARPLLRADPEVAVGIGVHAAGLLFAATAAVGMPILITARLHGGASVYALVALCTGVGALAGNLLVGRCVGRAATGWLRTYSAVWVVDGLILAGMGLAPTVGVLLALAAAAGLVAPALGVTLQTRLSQFPGPQRLRLIATDQGAVRTAGTAGMLLVPPLVALAPGAAFVVAGLCSAAVAAAAPTVARGLARRREVAVADPAG
jgi:hypothetical protein